MTSDFTAFADFQYGGEFDVNSIGVMFCIGQVFDCVFGKFGVIQRNGCKFRIKLFANRQVITAANGNILRDFEFEFVQNAIDAGRHFIIGEYCIKLAAAYNEFF